MLSKDKPKADLNMPIVHQKPHPNAANHVYPLKKYHQQKQNDRWHGCFWVYDNYDDGFAMQFMFPTYQYSNSIIYYHINADQAKERAF